MYVWGLQEGLGLIKEKGFYNMEVELDPKAIMKAVNSRGEDGKGNYISCWTAKSLSMADKRGDSYS